MSAHHIIL